MRLSLGTDLGPVLTGRVPAGRLTELIEIALLQDIVVELDFDGVEAISPSFADELFSKLPSAAYSTGAVTILNLAPHLESIVEFFTAPTGEPPTAATG